MDDVKEICRGHVLDEVEPCETSSYTRGAIKRALDGGPTDDARLVSIELVAALDPISVEVSRPVTGGNGDISEDYDVLPAVLGTGLYGCVRECRRRSTGEVHAVKTVDKSKVSCLDHVRREIELLRSVDHPGIVKMEGWYEDDHFVHIVTERYAGGELFDRIADNVTARGCLPEDQASNIIRSLLEAVRYLHSKDIVHRDIKPENILFESDEEGSSVKLVDFGLSRRHGLDDAPMTNAVGTSYYMSPGVLRGRYSRSCDLWAVGVVTYVLLCGYPPFNGRDTYDVQQSILGGNLVFDHGVWGNLSGTSRHFVGRLLRTGPSRIRTASEALRHPWLA